MFNSEDIDSIFDSFFTHLDMLFDKRDCGNTWLFIDEMVDKIKDGLYDCQAGLPVINLVKDICESLNGIASGLTEVAEAIQGNRE